MYDTAPRYASSLYASWIASESTTVVNQLTNSYKYMLGMSSRDCGVQSYSESSKKSSSFLFIMPVMRWSARERVAAKELEAVNRIVPPRCVDLRLAEPVSGWINLGLVVLTVSW
jgi:hypothetical protein